MKKMMTITDDLRKKLELIEDMPLDASDSIYLVLMVAGEKSAAFLQIESEPWREGDEPIMYPADTLLRLQESLDGTGLPHRLLSRGVTKAGLDQPSLPSRPRLHELIDLYVARDEATLNELIRARKEGDDRALGLVLGYPETAVNAFVEKHPKATDSLPLDVRLSVSAQFVAFMLSEDHWQDEVAYVGKWAETIRTLSPILYTSYVNRYSEINPYLADEVLEALKRADA